MITLVGKNYRKARNNTNKFIKVKKKEFLNQGFTKHKNNIKKTWEDLRHVVPSRNKDTKIPLINTDNGPVTELKDKANELNKFFSGIGPNLANRINENDFCDYKKISNNKRPTFNLVHVDYDYVFKQLTKLSNDKATGLDNIPSKLLKLVAPVITPIITHLINHSFTTCKFPSCWKRAKVIPVFKAGNHSDPSNYRPISILVVISKIAERAVFDQLYNYLNDNGLININQSGFRPIHSTSSA